MKNLFLFLVVSCLCFRSNLKAQTPFIGQILFVPYNFSPLGWHDCDGSLVKISDNDALFSLIGTTFGGDGQTTFALPDMRGRVFIDDGQGNNLSNFLVGQTGGVEKVTLASSQLPQHNHSVNAVTAEGNDNLPTGNLPVNTKSPDNEYSNQAANATMNPIMLSPSGGSQPHNNVQPYLTMKCVISLFGIYPSQN